ncbi:RUN domain-containing protein 1 [Aphelenchoides avenae]|nr:RUN domain-containing protein 1 [Aphelenchus avenae]
MMTADEPSMGSLFQDLIERPESSGFVSPSISAQLPCSASANHSDEDSGADIWATSSIGDDSPSQINNSEKLQELESEHERLSESILALSSHFAQVQLRIQQISQAPSDSRDTLLKELQEFASRGCIDIGEVKQQTQQIKDVSEQTGGVIDETIRQKRLRVLGLIRQLRQQTEELEKFAYENGDGEMPTRELKQRQKLVFDKLQERIQLKIDLDKFSEVELERSIEQGIDQVLRPMKEKEQVVDQLQTQITDLERYVAYLQEEVATGGNNIAEEEDGSREKLQPVRSVESANFRRIQKKPSMFGLIGCQSRRHFERNGLKNTLRGNHYGDQRARIELAVDAVMQVLKKYQLLSIERPEPDEELPLEKLNETIFERSEEAVVAIVRKEFCPALKDLLEHGMRSAVPPDSYLPKAFTPIIGCFPDRGARGSRPVPKDSTDISGRPLTHVWDVIMLYYDVKNAQETSSAAVGKLSTTFGLDSVSGKSATSQQVLLATIDHVASTHSKLKRSPDTMWKAFVSAALNHKRLPGWIRMIFRSDIVLSKCYHSWAYIARTGCEDIRPLLEKLHDFTFDLPVDLALRPFDHIKEAF